MSNELAKVGITIDDLKQVLFERLEELIRTAGVPELQILAGIINLFDKPDFESAIKRAIDSKIKAFTVYE